MNPDEISPAQPQINGTLQTCELKTCSLLRGHKYTWFSGLLYKPVSYAFLLKSAKLCLLLALTNPEKD
jgi:hypothetical protein